MMARPKQEVQVESAQEAEEDEDDAESFIPDEGTVKVETQPVDVTVTISQTVNWEALSAKAQKLL